jgi:cytochrome c biogenesis protein CcdA
MDIVLLLLGAVAAGALTTLAPCVLPLLPVIVGRTAVPARTAPISTRPIATRPIATRPITTRPMATGLPANRPLVVTAALACSVILFTLLLKATTALIGVPREVWQVASGGLLILIGITQVRPGLWDALSIRLGLGSRAGTRLAVARERGGLLGDVLTGAALGPVFSSCSPLYGYVVVTALPAEPAVGLLLLLGYVLGLSATLLAIAQLGRRAVQRLRWAADPEGWFRRGLGLLLVAVGLVILTGGDHALQTWVLEHSPIRPWELDSGFVPQG